MPFGGLDDGELNEIIIDRAHSNIRKISEINPSHYNKLQFDFGQYDEVHFIDNDTLDIDSNFFNQFTHINGYCSTDDLNSYLPKSQSRNLQSLLHLNAHSLEPKIDISVNIGLLSHRFSIIAVTETWSSSANEQRIELPGYNKIIKSRESRGGGVALFLTII